jgi:hypothetical protein
MIAAFMSIALASQLGSPLVILVGDYVPIIDVQRSCKETAATNKAVDLDLSRSVANCLRDEDAAQVQLIGIWSTYSASIRDRCAQEATIPGTGGSYIDLLTCVEMTDPSTSPTTALRGASKNRNND